MAGMIPLRPKEGVFDLTQEEMTGLSWYVLSGCQREDAFLKFVRPDFIGSKSTPTIKAAVAQFFSSKDAKAYIEAYRMTIESELAPTEKVKTETFENLERRKEKAKNKLIDFALNLANNIGQAEDPEFVMKIADKCQLLDIEEKSEEKPRRYLPVTCSSCEYRKFVEENCERVADENQ